MSAAARDCVASSIYQIGGRNIMDDPSPPSTTDTNLNKGERLN